MADLSIESLLDDGLVHLGLEAREEQRRLLIDYLRLLQKWNGVYNLTAVRDEREMLSHHLLDSLAAVSPLLRHLEGRAAQGHTLRVLDVGSGGGLPGVVLATMTGLPVDCVDAVGKKAAFIQQVAAQLGLRQLRGLHARVETLAGQYDVVTSRAFASLADFVTLTSSLLAPGGVWMALKGKLPEQEMAELPQGVEVFHVEQLQVPQLDAQRCIVWLRRR